MLRGTIRERPLISKSTKCISRFKTIVRRPPNIAKTPQTQSGVYLRRKIHIVGGWFFQEILPLCGSILQAGTCQIFSLAENPRWSPSVTILLEYLAITPSMSRMVNFCPVLCFLLARESNFTKYVLMDGDGLT